MPACADPQIINCQGITVYTMKPLQTTCLNGVSHQHAMQDLVSSATLHHPAPQEAIGFWILPASMLCSRQLPSVRIVCCTRRAKLTRNEEDNTGARAGALAPARPSPTMSSQRSLHNAPIFRLLLKVAVNGTHQCDYSNFCGNPGSQPLQH